MDPKRIYVSGFPSFTQSQDLMQVFNQYGTIKVEKINKKYAVVLFPDEESVKEVIERSGKIVNYGEFLTIKPYNRKLETTAPKREFTRSKQKESIIAPQMLDLSGDFYQQLDNVLSAVRLTQQEVCAVSSLYSDLQDALRTLWPGCVATPFGSITTGLGIKSSDADCFVSLGTERITDAVGRAKRALLREPRLFAEVLAIPQAHTPIVKFFHVPTGTNCDVTFKTPLGTYNSRLVSFMLHADPRLVPLAVLVKYWAKVHGFSGSGRLTNYALTVMILFYLQQPPVSVLPSVRSLQEGFDQIVDGWNVAFDDRLDRLPASTNTSSIPELLGGFFQYYSTFDFDRLVICPYLGRPITKESFKRLSSLPPEMSLYRRNLESGAAGAMRFTTSICVQDPFELCHNVASCVSSRLYEEVQAYFRFAALAYDTEKLKDCRQLLRTILLRKPKIPRLKAKTEFKATISSYVIQNIESQDRRSVIRDEMLRMFMEMCKIELSELEADDKGPTKKRKDKYMGVVTGAIWRRKQYTKTHNAARLGLVERQAQITEEIMNAEKEKINLKFCLTLAFTSESHANATVKLKEGDAAVFKEFGTFFLHIMQNWFGNLLKPYLKPKEKKKLKEDKEGKENKETELDVTLGGERQGGADQETSPTNDTSETHDDTT
ncbi:speckle targeted PIP5K1A-regulated poly(A) polymerase-like isoform X1 [Danaus plexippus]|uniref:speckle targeted PIP5K1A-regulated poly(A) polymerase-like isoform X1 n=2 Tax=Danaus plexippus TaxID=13037 RepID=UPI002AB232AF|nr:speckle targeted PIP5K1A-regulated poly(A) polymerase-like isoform X1 [Danaus plexippus]XP_032518373.2 speckle targeted PIP5K1A-regulated poly(A) polymerase-like isoform X1 [Danaus plexippus]XP_032518375.2 speckle targeted PIP5K1A-regulated poly(A) polymerase-like isoform X1 [Danaus plexippus]XP_032518377.2 speckle targeted PIP5K1A-regulated poly(A) polymerase-like isoform X1 [Danaus plexippus]XP_032518378.2 speckle targeted PIP5K1A-regulated poly(A) polymerase-like isoform X1 [Danaus plexip